MRLHVQDAAKKPLHRLVLPCEDLPNLEHAKQVVAIVTDLLKGAREQGLHITTFRGSGFTFFIWLKESKGGPILTSIDIDAGHTAEMAEILNAVDAALGLEPGEGWFLG